MKLRVLSLIASFVLGIIILVMVCQDIVQYGKSKREPAILPSVTEQSLNSDE